MVSRFAQKLVCSQRIMGQKQLCVYKKILGEIFLKTLAPRKLRFKKISGPKKYWVKRNFWSKKIFGPKKILDPNFFFFFKFWIQNYFGSKKIVGQKIWVKKLWVQNNFGYKKIPGYKNFLSPNKF